MKIAYWWSGILLASLAGCAGLGQVAYHGESTTFGGDNILRNDVTRMITVQEGAMNCRNISRINAKVDRAARRNNRWVVQETWIVHACGKTHRYTVSLREDARGETDFSVGFRPE